MPAVKQRLIFDNSNLNESYSGVTTPLTFSFAKRVYSNVYKEFSRVIGTPEKKIKENWAMYDEMLAFIGGRMYYNLLNWYRLISFIPGYSFNREFFEKMLGVSKGVSYDPREKPRGIKKLLEVLLLFRQVVMLIFQFTLLNKNVEKFLQEFDAEFKKLNSLNIKKFSDQELVRFYLRYEQKFSNRWRITIINDLGVMIVTGILRKMASLWLKDKNNLLINCYLSGIKNLASKKPAENFEKLLTQIRKNKEFRELFLNNGSQKILEIISGNKKFLKLKNILENYFHAFGDRAPSELKMESKTYTDNKELFITLIKGQLMDVTKIRKENEGSKEDFEFAMARSLKKLGLIKGLLFQLCVKLSQDYIRNREAARLRRSRIFGFARKVFKEFGERLAAYKYLKEKSDIFYLSVEEIIGIFNGTLIQKDLQSQIIQRKKEFAVWSKIEIPTRIETQNSVYEYELKRLSEIKKRNPQKTTNPKILKGVTYSTGRNGNIISGEALVLKNFNYQASFVDKILITRQTDPGWTPIFPYLKGVIIERGGMLSHAAIVAREFCLPCIQVAKATNFISTGQKIEIDTHSGTIKLQ